MILSADVSKARPVHTTPEKFENGCFPSFTRLKTHQMFSVHTTSEKFEDATITLFFFFRRSLNRAGLRSHDDKYVAVVLMLPSYVKTRAPWGKTPLSLRSISICHEKAFAIFLN